MRRFGLFSSIVVILVMVSLSPNPLFSQRSVFLGSRTVGFRTDYDEIAVGRMRGYFRQLLFKVDRNDMELFDLKIIFHDGTRVDLPTRLVFHKRGRSRLLDLPGNRRMIRKIVFRYRSIGSFLERRAVIRVYGIR